MVDQWQSGIRELQNRRKEELKSSSSARSSLTSGARQQDVAGAQIYLIRDLIIVYGDLREMCTSWVNSFELQSLGDSHLSNNLVDHLPNSCNSICWVSIMESTGTYAKTDMDYERVEDHVYPTDKKDCMTCLFFQL